MVNEIGVIKEVKKAHQLQGYSSLGLRQLEKELSFDLGQSELDLLRGFESDAKGDTLKDYCTDEEEQTPTDDDTDIDS